MPTVHITLTDTATGGVSISSSFQPAVGKRCSKAEAHALEILTRTRKQWGADATEVVHMTVGGPLMCQCSHFPSERELDTGACSVCAKPIIASL